MKILICNERFLFRFGVDRCLLMLGRIWKDEGHEIVMMGNKLDPAAVDKCSDRFIAVPEAPDYLHGNEFTLQYLRAHWDEWFTEKNAPDLALVAGWPFYSSIPYLRGKCGCAVFQDYGAVPTEGMAKGPRTVQLELRRLRRQNLPQASRVVAISRFLRDSQSIPDAAGAAPTAVVHCGVDHIVQRLWSGRELNLRESGVLGEIRALKEAGERIIFQPGRWENGNYKNSAASVEVSRHLTKLGIPHRILVLSGRDGLGDLPADAADHFFCLGFVDDETMRAAMELSDLGISPTLWEGFDLPLGEMQWLNRPMLVLNVGAHPEVVCDPYFLCADMREMAEKAARLLREGLPMGEEAFRQRCEAFRQTFTWQNAADGLMAEFRRALLGETVLLVDVTNACHDTANSGVMRVTRKLSRYLQERMETVFVLWDDSIRAFVLPYDGEVATLCAYRGPDAGAVAHRSREGQPRALLADLLPGLKGTRRILLWIETVRADVLSQARPWLASHRIASAAVFHDAIPVLRPELVSPEVRENHDAYMAALAGCDLVMATAAHNQADLEAFWAERGGPVRAKARTCPLAAEIDGVPRAAAAQDEPDGPVRILFVSTLEPRKNHIRFLKAVGLLLRDHPELAGRIEVRLVGNRYAGNAEIPAFVEDFCRRHAQVRWLGVVDDETLRQEYASCTFTAYPSEIEGFGMPIIESLWAGKPCLCSRDGSIGELAAAGGCLCVNVLDEAALAEGLRRLITDPELRRRLRREAAARPITTWDQYADSVAAAFTDLSVHFPDDGDSGLPEDVCAQLRRHFEGWTGRRVITVSNYYPPAFVGGAEIIAHRQLLTLHADGHCRGVAFSLDISRKQPEGTVTFSTHEDVPVVRVCMPPSVFDQNAVSFFHPAVNDAFRALVRLVRPDVVHCHNMFGLSLGIVDIARAAGAKVFFTLHDNWGFCYKNTMLTNQGELCRNILDCDRCKENLTADGIRIPMGVRRSYLRRVFEKADAFISPSCYLADMYLRAGFDWHRMHVLWNGIDADEYRDVEPLPSPEIRLTFAGYFGAHKGIDVLIRAVARLNRPNIRINLVGSGAEEPNYRALADSLGIGSCLRFWGKLDNREVKKAYRETDIYCLPSVWPENQPVSITEAMACGIPVVAADLGGSRELVADGETGFLFPAGDDEALAERLARLADDAGLRRHMGEAGRQRIAQTSFHAQMARLTGLYDTVPAAPKPVSKPVILVKGRVLPPHIHRATPHDVLLWEWVLDESEERSAAACLLLPGETADARELRFLRASGIPVLVHERAQAPGCGVRVYEDEADLLGMIAEL